MVWKMSIKLQRMKKEQFAVCGCFASNITYMHLYKLNSTSYPRLKITRNLHFSKPLRTQILHLLIRY